ncbi:MAG: hypothetical protein M3Y77_15335 [Actinomycetota bacterium]|nr:hypothetical protein [Actinomycetota bacterium]
MRVAVVAGPGGAGTTTVAALTAVAAAAQGRRTVLMSADPSVEAVLAVPADERPSDDPSSRRKLTVRRPDALRMTTKSWPAVGGYLSSLGIDGDLDPGELAGIPGAGALAMLLEIAAVARSADCEVLVVDVGSSVVSLLALPESLGFLTDLLVPTPLRIIRQAGGRFSRPAAEPTDQQADRLGELLGELLLAQAVLCDPDICSVHLVTGPEPLRMAAARRMIPLLALYGAGLGRVIVNRVPKRRAAIVGRVVADWPAEIVSIAEQAAEPTGAALDALAHTVFGDRNLLSVSVAPALAEARADAVDDETGAFTMRIPLPLADKAALDLARSDDDLLITVFSSTRRVELPSVLRRCAVTGATFADDALTVGFLPDPDRWPQALATSPGGAASGVGATGAPDAPDAQGSVS